ncbi:MAG: MotA/TolQ/ExbB proton channel family protein [Verrucomicrobia bacterium]|nr:MotA/TolQ/ExbB proton channel family protein [Verrucomicrobiota bacterium]
MTWLTTTVDMCMRGGIFMIPLALVALGSIILMIERMLFLHENCIDGDRFQFELRTALKENNLEQAIVLAARTKGFIGRIIEECLLRIKAGEKDVDDATEKVILSEMTAMEKSRGWLVAFYQVAPLLGILGTVWGLIVAFMVIEKTAATDPRMLAGGIYQALITTVTGLLIAIPVILFVEHLRKNTNYLLSLLDIYLAEIRDWIRQNGKLEVKRG